MAKVNVYEVAKLLVGPTMPVGETNADNQRFENLEVMVELADLLMGDIAAVARYNKNRPEHSMQKAGKRAHSFFITNGMEDY